MEGSTSAASRSPSPVVSESSVDDTTARHVAEAPSQPSANTVLCEWKDCARSFADIPSLVGHLDSEHISAHRPSYTCERPFICASPDCDKSFTRSDTLAKHMRQKHNISPSAPGRGGHRKRKRSPTPVQVHQHIVVPEREHPASPPLDGAPSHYNFANRTYAQHHDGRDSGFNTFRVNPPPALTSQSVVQKPSEYSPRDIYVQYDGRAEESPASSDDDAAVTYNPEVAGGRSKAMVQYLIMKAKYRYVMDTHGLLTDELEALKRQEREEWHEKEAGVDRVLRVFGPQSEQLIHDSEALPNGKRPYTQDDSGYHLDRRMDVDSW